jgi:hydrogenase maturation protease
VTARVVVIGLGNPYRCDDGLGPAVAGLLRARRLPGVAVREAPADSAALLGMWSGARLAIVVDAVHGPAARAGRVHRLAVPAAGRAGRPGLARPGRPGRPGKGRPARPGGPDLAGTAQAGSHGVRLGPAVELARVLGRLPRRLVLYAVEVTRTGHGRGLSPAVAAAAARVAAEVAAASARVAQATPGGARTGPAATRGRVRLVPRPRRAENGGLRPARLGTRTLTR